jgi:glycosyltransferase involved in cell wall biosynthesis
MTGHGQVTSRHVEEPPAVSIVVPTRDRPEPLGRCLAALRRADPQVPHEIIVVDDASRDRAELEKIVGTNPRTRLVSGSGKGPAAARNAGARAARAPIICFTDDDCEPTPEWLSRLSAALVAGVSAVAGTTLNGRPQDHFATASQVITNYLVDHGQVPFAPSNNLCCRTDVVRELPFDESFQAAAGEDREWCVQLVSSGHSLARERRAVVAHAQTLGATGFVRQQFRYGRAAYRFHTGTPPRTHEAPQFQAQLVAHGFRHGPVVGLMVLLAQAIVSAGYLTELVANRRSDG